jgi:L-2,4-diaminobutyrate decarboxylase
MQMHGFDAETDDLAAEVITYARERLSLDPPPLDGPSSYEDLREAAGATITETGLGSEALRLFRDILAPACISTDHPRYLSFIPCAPTEASSMFDLVVGASGIYGGSWMEGAGAVYAENQALRWIADLAGLPAQAGGAFVQGGTIGNLSALVAARADAQRRRGGRPERWVVACGSEAHSSIEHAALVMDIDVLAVPVGTDGRMTGEALAHALQSRGGSEDVFAVVATGGTTNYGIVDDLAGISQVCRERGIWMHVDGAYGLAALAAPSTRSLFAGVEHADSLIVDPHKWLFAPFDACALIYRNPDLARAVHVQHAAYLDVLTDRPDWNPSDYAVQLSRRARGLPFWFSLAVHGTRAYALAVERTMEVARFAEQCVRDSTYLELIRDPMLSVVVFRRIGWTDRDYDEWSDRLLADGYAFVVPTKHEGETVTRVAIVNPRTTEDDITGILTSMA